MSLQTIAIAKLRPSHTDAQVQRRKYFDKDKMQELAESIAAHGVLQPIVVRPIERAAGLPYLPGIPTHEIVAGERRYLAVKLAKLVEIPAMVLELTDEQVIEVQLIENLQREDVHPMQEAEGYHELVTKHGHKVDDIYARVGKSRTYVYGRLKLMALSPKCRKAFHADEISASIAEKLARIPVEKTQDEALELVTENDWSYRRAAELIRARFMLKLADAPFPVDVELAGAGPCGTCPKRTGNQPELFGDVKSADVCTDTVCFAAKSRAHGQQLVEQARERGQPVLTGAAAKKVIPHGIRGDHSYITGGFKSLDDRALKGGKVRKVKAIVGKDVERTLVVDGETGRAIEVVAEADVREAGGGGSAHSPAAGVSAAEKKAKLDKRVTYETYRQVRTKLPPPSLLEIAGALFQRLEHDATKVLCKVRGFEPPTKTEQYRGKVTDYAAIGKTLDKLSQADLGRFINDCIYVRELMYGGDYFHRVLGSTPKIKELAELHHIDVAAIRRALAPKSRKKKPATKKKAKHS